MKRKIKAACLGVLAAFVLVDYANAQSPEQISRDRTIFMINTYATYAAVRFTPDFDSSQCNPDSTLNNAVIIDFGANKDAKAMYAAALSAQLTGKKVGFGIAGCFSKFGGGVPNAYRVDISD